MTCNDQIPLCNAMSRAKLHHITCSIANHTALQTLNVSISHQTPHITSNYTYRIKTHISHQCVDNETKAHCHEISTTPREMPSPGKEDHVASRPAKSLTTEAGKIHLNVMTSLPIL